jgi:hypothetical protein
LAATARRPRVLDLDPTADLDPFTSRVDALIRAVLADPTALEPGSLALATDRAARLQVPSAPDRVVAEALHRLVPFVSSPLARRIAASADVVRSLPWTLPWPIDDPEPTVIRGRLDIAFRESSGTYDVISISIDQRQRSCERLRLQFARRAAEAIGLGPMARGWLVNLWPGGETTAEGCFDDEVIDEILAGLPVLSG